MAGANQKYKDRLFHFVFGNKDHKEWTLSLYNAVNNSYYTDPDEIQITTIEEILYLGMRNDVSFLIANEMNLYEQQSTFNPNMPIRGLQYLANLYDKYITANDLNKFSSRQLQLPVPKLVVFYNGSGAAEEEQFLTLRDAFLEDSSPDVEVRVRMLNINYGHNLALMERCRPLLEYTWITDTISRNRETMSLDEAVDLALRDMPDDFLLKPLLRINQAEVKGMLLTEYDEERQRMLDRKDGYEEGMEAGRREGIVGAIDMLRDLGLDENKIIEEISSKYNISREEAAALTAKNAAS